MIRMALVFPVECLVISEYRGRIAEGFGRHSDKDFANFLSMAHASVSEVQSHLYVALDLSYVQKHVFEELYGLLDEIGRMTFRLAVHLRTSGKNRLS